MKKSESILEELAPLKLNEHEALDMTPINPWDQAALSAEVEIGRLKIRAKALRSSIRMFRKAAAAGIEFPVS